MLLQVFANAVVSGSLLALVALSFGLIYSTTKVFHFAHAGVYTTSAYVLYFCFVQRQLPVYVSLLLAIFSGALAGAALERFVYAPLLRKRASPGVFLIASLGAYAALTNAFAAVFGNEGKVLMPGAGHVFSFGAVFLTRIQLAEVVISLGLCSLTIAFIKLSNLGRLLQALVDNPSLLPVFGVDPFKVRLTAFALGSALAGVAASLVAFDVGLDPYGGLKMLLLAAVSTIIGGVNVIEGAVVGAFLLALMQNLVVYHLSARWEQSVTFFLLIGFLVFRPAGLLGPRRRLEEV